MKTSNLITTITLKDAIRKEVAAAIVAENHPGDSGQIRHYTDGNEVWTRGTNSPWSPWSDNTTVVSVRKFVGDDIISCGVPQGHSEYANAANYAAWETAYKASAEAEKTYTTQDVRDWVLDSGDDVMIAEVDEYEEEYEAETIDFVAGELASAVIIERDDEGYEEYSRV